VLRFENVSFSYDGKERVLKNINFNLGSGKRIVFLGENGSGKSTLFLLMNGVLKANSGSIYCGGEKLNYKKDSLNSIRKNVGVVFQDPEVQIFAPLVFQEVGFGPKNLGYTDKELGDIIDNNLKSVNMYSLKDKLCHNLSYGQKKRLSIASILAMGPQVLVLDEPLVWLDTKNRNKVLEILEEQVKKQKTVVVSTHDVDFAYQFADYIFVLKDGEIVKEGKKDAIFMDRVFLKNVNLEEPTVLKMYRYIGEKNGLSKDEFLEVYMKYLGESY
jgi:cobalt/nickel transport system ATP-binding protein